MECCARAAPTDPVLIEVVANSEVNPVEAALTNTDPAETVVPNTFATAAVPPKSVPVLTPVAVKVLVVTPVVTRAVPGTSRANAGAVVLMPTLPAVVVIDPMVFVPPIAINCPTFAVPAVTLVFFRLAAVIVPTIRPPAMLTFPEILMDPPVMVLADNKVEDIVSKVAVGTITLGAVILVVVSVNNTLVVDAIKFDAPILPLTTTLGVTNVLLTHPDVPVIALSTPLVALAVEATATGVITDATEATVPFTKPPVTEATLKSALSKVV